MPVPWMASGVVVPEKTSGPPTSVIVRGDEKRFGCVSNVTVLGAGFARFAGLSLKLTLAHATAERMLPYPTASTVVVTRYDELAS